MPDKVAVRKEADLGRNSHRAIATLGALVVLIGVAVVVPSSNADASNSADTSTYDQSSVLNVTTGPGCPTDQMQYWVQVTWGTGGMMVRSVGQDYLFPGQLYFNGYGGSYCSQLFCTGYDYAQAYENIQWLYKEGYADSVLGFGVPWCS